MKFKSLYILLIGMISFTVMASTPPPEQKLKTEPVAIQMIDQHVLTVEPITIESNSIEVTKVTQENQAFKKNHQNITFSCSNYPDDVGWILTTSYEYKSIYPIIRHLPKPLHDDIFRSYIAQHS